MAFDGIVIANIVKELREHVLNGRIYKIYQPEADELNLVIKTPQGNHRLLLSASATLPLVYLTTESRNNPMTAPNFCMLLRKHIGNGRITGICQPGFERIVEFTIEHLDEMGDLCRKKLIIEIMGKHSNIIFCDDEGTIIDSIKRVGAQISSVREVLPGRSYELPPKQEKISPLELTEDYFRNQMLTKPTGISKMIYTSLTGVSPVVANELCYRAGLDGDASVTGMGESRRNEQAVSAEPAEKRLWTIMEEFRTQLVQEQFAPTIYYDEAGAPLEFSSIPLTMYSDMHCEAEDSISSTLQTYYAAKNSITRIRQKSSDLRRIVNTAIERTVRKYDLQLSQLKSTDKRDKYRIYGELINTYGYGIEPEAQSFQALNYYTNEEITIPLDSTLTPAANSKRYFERYNKLKRTYEALTEQIQETSRELEHLKSVRTALDLARGESDLSDIKRELTEYGYIKNKGGGRKKEKSEKSKPLHYISSDGFHMYVGKNNYQNEELTFKVADGGDMWFHAKQIPGSHVIVKTQGQQELPDRTYEEAARLAAYYSSSQTAAKVEVDYTRRSNLKKVPKGAPGFVIYHTNYSMSIAPDIRGIKEVDH